MIGFFRRIRKKLADDNQFLKYSRYAIGEILLVVIGILVALQVNNWNESSKLENAELKILSVIKANLSESLEQINESNSFNRNQLNNFGRIIKYVEEDLPYNSELDSAFGLFPNWSTPYLSYSGYESLKSRGIDMLENDYLKEEIVKLYETEFSHFLGDWDRWEWNINQDIVMPYFAMNMRADFKEKWIARPNDFEALKKDTIFLNVLSVIIRTRRKGITDGIRLSERLEIIIEDIHQELMSRGYSDDNEHNELSN